MLKRELLQLQLDQLRWENKQLQDENVRLRDERQESPASTSVADVETEIAKCLEEQRHLEDEIRTRKQLLRRSRSGKKQVTSVASSECGDGELQPEAQVQQLQLELSQALERSEEAENLCSRLQEELKTVHCDAELQQFRAVDRERDKWEAREQRLIAQLAHLERRLEAIEAIGTSRKSRSQSSSVERPPSSTTSVSLPDADKERSKGIGRSSRSTTAATTAATTAKVQQLQQQLLQQTPPVTKFTWEAVGEETFEDWLSQFEMAAEVCGWEGKGKLAHLVTRLKGQALSYYHSCPPAEKSDYKKLTQALSTRFTLVQLPVVQTTLFHERKQKPKEEWTRMHKTFGVCSRRHTPRCDKAAKRLRKWEDLFSRISLWLACSQN